MLGMLSLALLLLPLSLSSSASAAPPVPAPAASEGFDVVALGVQGGLLEGDLTSFLLKRHDGDGWLGLDAGTVGNGLKKTGIAFDDVRAWCVSHPHLDHVAGLAENIVDGTGIRPLYGLPSTIDALRDHLWNGVLWANFGNEGKEPLRRLRYERLTPGRAVRAEEVGLTIEALPLAHGGAISTVFLISDGSSSVAFFGDTGPDLVEQSTKLDAVWQRLAPLVRGHRLRAIFIEASYPSDRADSLLFGHLTPRHLMVELRALAAMANPSTPQTALQGVTVVVQHIKPKAGGPTPREVIEAELKAMNTLSLTLLFPQQGDRFRL